MAEVLKALWLVSALVALPAAAENLQDPLPPVHGGLGLRSCAGPFIGAGTAPGTCGPVPGAWLAPGAAATNLGFAPLPHVASQAALALAAGFLGTVVRGGWAAPGDGGAATYVWSASACSLNAGAGDGGSQAPAAGGGCWTLDPGHADSDVRVWGAVCDKSTDDTAAFNAAVASGRRTITVPPGCYIAGTVTLGQNQTLNGTGQWAGGWKSNNDYKAIANLILGPSARIVSGAGATSYTVTTNSSVQNMVVVASNYANPQTLRDAYNAARAFTGTAIICQTADFAIRNTLLVGFQYPVIATNNGMVSLCDRLVMDQVQGDNTNGLIFQQSGGVNQASADVPRLTNIEWFPFTTFVPGGGGQYEALAIANVSSQAGLFEITLASVPPTPLTTGDIVQIGPTTGMPTLYSSEPGTGWPITVIDSTHFTLNGSAFAGSYSVAPAAYFSALWRAGVGFSATNGTATNISNYFAQSYQTAYYVGTNTGMVTCSACVSEWQPETVAPPQSIGIDLEGNTWRNTFVGGSVVAGIGARVNSTDGWPQAFVGMNSIAGLSYVLKVDGGAAQVVGGSLFPLASASIYLGASGSLCLQLSNYGGAPLTGSLTNLGCAVAGSIYANGAVVAGQAASPGATNQMVVNNQASTSGTRASVLAQTPSAAVIVQQDEAGKVGSLYSGPGDTGGLTVDAQGGPATLQSDTGDVNVTATSGNVLITPSSGAGHYAQILNLATSCASIPSGAIYNSGGALRVCP